MPDVAVVFPHRLRESAPWKLTGVLNGSNGNLPVGWVAMTESTVIVGGAAGVFVFII
jgi:hypothetical protein